jgi:outer membrane protein TolC
MVAKQVRVCQVYRNMKLRFAVLLATLPIARPSFARPPLEAYLSAATSKNPEGKAANASVKQREADVNQARARLLPALAARGSYTINQSEIVTQFGPDRTLTIQPTHQFDAVFTLDVPLVDLGKWASFAAQKSQVELAKALHLQTDRSLRERVLRAYTVAQSTSALIRVAESGLSLAERNQTLTKDRAQAGVVSELDLTRADANVERAKQEVSDARLGSTLAERALESLTGIRTEGGQDTPADVSLAEEAPLSTWMAEVSKDHPDRQVAEAERELAESSKRAARAAWLPVLAGQATERLTNATGFLGRVDQFTVGASLTFRLDTGTPALADSAHAAGEAASARAEIANQRTHDSVFEAWHRVKAGIVRVKAARSQAKSNDKAAELAQDRFAIGAATQLDVTQAQRDAFATRVNLLQAELDLIQVRALLRFAVDKPISHRSAKEQP